MNNEIKEILEQLEWYRKIGKKDVYYPECVLPNKKAFILLDYITSLQKTNKNHSKKLIELGEKIDIMQKYFQLIIDLGYDYDGFNNVEGLKMLISNLVRYARMGKNYDIKEIVYINGDKTYNILGEEIEFKVEKGSEDNEC